jgi:uncharacterized protein (TIGR01777 family)
MTIVVSGASGLIGTALLEALRADGHEVVALVRREVRAPHEVTWSPQLGARGATPELRAALEGATAVVNLSGAGVADRRWSEAYRREILDSRVAATTCLATAVAETRTRPGVFVSGSASGIYGDTGPVAVEEDAPVGSTVLARVASAWEQAAEPAREAGVRVAHPRTSVVADAEAGAFGRWLPFIRAGVGGRLGSGRQWWSLISLRDEVAGIRHLIEDESLEGAYNFAAPEQVTNGDLADALGRALHRPTLVPVPGFGLRIALGDFAEELLIDQRLSPARLLASGFEFRDPTVDAIVRGMLAPAG